MKKTIKFTDLDNVIIDIIESYKEIFIKTEEPITEDNEFTISFEYQTFDGEVMEFDENSHYGRMIMSDDDSKTFVNGLVEIGVVPETNVGWISVDYPNKIVEVE